MAILATGLWLLFLGIVGVRFYVGKPTYLTLLEYQQGVLYRKGRPVRDLKPGRIRVWAGIEQVIVLDTRTIPIRFENRAVTLVDGMTAVYGFSGSATIQDARRTLYSAQRFSEVPIVVLLSCSRSALNCYASNELRMNERTIEAEISQQAKLKLEAQGFNLLTFRLTQFEVDLPSEDPDDTLPEPDVS
jgi:regulator of protease activity HflC (stomatin/prohibitin superfamily)